MRPIALVSAFALLEHARRKLLAFFVIASLVVTVIVVILTLSKVAPDFFGSDNALVEIVSTGLFGLAATVGALTVSMGNFNQTFREGEAVLVLSRPVSRWQYSLGRMSASSGIVIGMCVALATQIQVIQIVTENSRPGILWATWGISAYNLILLAVITSFYSSVISIPVLALVAGYITQAVLGGLQTLKSFADAGNITGWFPRVIDVLYYITPRPLAPPIDRVTAPAGMEELIPKNSPELIALSVAWLLALILLTIYRVNRKEV